MKMKTDQQKIENASEMKEIKSPKAQHSSVYHILFNLSQRDSSSMVSSENFGSGAEPNASAIASSGVRSTGMSVIWKRLKIF